MARHIWSVLCERALVDHESNSVSLIDVVEEISIDAPLPPEPVSVPLRLALVSYWTRTARDTPEQGHTRFLVQSPLGELLARGRDIQVDLLHEVRAQTLGRIEVMPLQGEGPYHFIVEYRPLGDPGWTECTRVPVDVVARPAVGQEPPAAAR